MRIKISESFFHAPIGSTLIRIENTYQLEVCDMCGKKKKCDWFEWDPHISGMTGMDVCRTCAKIHEVKE